MQQITGFAQRNALLFAAAAFALGCALIGWSLVGPLMRPAPPAAVAPLDEPLIDEPLVDEPLEPLDEPAPTPLPAQGLEEAVIVYVSGSVRAPDVYRLPATARVKDAVLAAGGLAADADPNAINLAARLSDEQHIYVPRQGEAPLADVAPAAPAAPGAADGGDAGALIDLNAASAADLDELPGIGPALAERIVQHRAENGPFATIDDLANVKGIGPALIEKIAPLVTVGT